MENITGNNPVITRDNISTFIQVRSDYRATKKKRGAAPTERCAGTGQVFSHPDGYREVGFCKTHGLKCKKMPAWSVVRFENPDREKIYLPPTLDGERLF